MGRHAARKKSAPTSPRKARRAAKKARKKAVPRSRLGRFMFRWGWIFPLLALVVGGTILAIVYAFADIKLPDEIKLDSSAEVYDREGRPIGTFSGEERRFLIPEGQLENWFERDAWFVDEAVISAEDRDFYKHNGVSFRGIARAAWANLTGGEVQQGGSTITQQYIKNAVIKNFERTVTRKVKEAIYAIKLEREYSKKQILGFYLNTIYLGRGAYGIEAAARAYWGKHAKWLELDEAAYLASIIPSPEQYQPNEKPKQALERRNRVLQTMFDQGHITAKQLARAKKKPLVSKPEAKDAANWQSKDQDAAYFLEWIRRDILEPDKDIGGRCLYTCGLKIYTTLDLDMQAQAEDAVDAILTDPADPPASLVAMTPGGKVRAMVGGPHYRNLKKARGYNYAVDGGRQAGSSFKTYTLAAAIDNGISPDSAFSGASPRTFDEPPCGDPTDPWEVENYGGSSYGTMTLDQATTNSVNTIYAQLIEEVGPENVAKLLEDVGFGEDINPYCSLALGGSDLNATPLQMARGYSMINNHGVVPNVTPVLYVEDSEGHCLKEFVPIEDKDCDEEVKDEPERVMEANDSYILTESLTHVVEGGTAVAAGLSDRPVAGKTGTTQNNTDAWFVGYVPQLTTAVWMGYPCQPREPKDKDACEDAKQGNEVVPRMQYCADPVECRPVHGQEVTGGSSVGPAAIWNAFMDVATDEMEPMAFPVAEDDDLETINPQPTYDPGPYVAPTEEPTEKPTAEPTLEPEPTTEPEPTPEPTEPEPEPTEPEPEPTVIPTGSPP